jgi:hypothetical protein
LVRLNVGSNEIFRSENSNKIADFVMLGSRRIDAVLQITPR